MSNKVESGNSQNLTNRGRGRPKGSENKATRTFRETVNSLLEGNAENVSKWLQQVAEGMPADEDNGIKAIPPAPDKALSILSQLAEYATPKLARTELTGDLTLKKAAADMTDDELMAVALGKPKP